MSLGRKNVDKRQGKFCTSFSPRSPKDAQQKKSIFLDHATFGGTTRVPHRGEVGPASSTRDPVAPDAPAASFTLMKQDGLTDKLRDLNPYPRLPDPQTSRVAHNQRDRLFSNQIDGRGGRSATAESSIFFDTLRPLGPLAAGMLKRTSKAASLRDSALEATKTRNKLSGQPIRRPNLSPAGSVSRGVRMAEEARTLQRRESSQSREPRQLEPSTPKPPRTSLTPPPPPPPLSSPRSHQDTPRMKQSTLFAGMSSPPLRRSTRLSTPMGAHRDRPMVINDDSEEEGMTSPSIASRSPVSPTKSFGKLPALSPYVVYIGMWSATGSLVGSLKFRSDMLETFVKREPGGSPLTLEIRYNDMTVFEVAPRVEAHSDVPVFLCIQTHGAIPEFADDYHPHHGNMKKRFLVFFLKETQEEYLARERMMPVKPVHMGERDASAFLERGEYTCLRRERQSDPRGTRSKTRAGARWLSSAKPIITFPPNHRDAVCVTETDMKCLEEGEFLNDTIVDFYLKYIEHRILTPCQRERYYFFNSYFYTCLGRACDLDKGFEMVKKWTRNIDIFSKDYVIVPINDTLHWSVAIVCFPRFPAVWDEERAATLLHLDSLQGHRAQKVFRILRKYLSKEWEDKRIPYGHKGRKEFTKRTVPGFCQLKIPGQDNSCDCGVFVIHYVETFVQNPPTNCHEKEILALELNDMWFKKSAIKTKRSEVRDIILTLQESVGEKDESSTTDDPMEKEINVRDSSSEASVGSKRSLHDKKPLVDPPPTAEEGSEDLLRSHYRRRRLSNDFIGVDDDDDDYF